MKFNKKTKLLIPLILILILLGVGIVISRRPKDPEIIERGRTSTTVYAGKDKEGNDLFKTSVHLNPLHFQNEKGEWQEYDTTLISTNKNDADYQLKSSDHQVYFTKNIGGATPISVEKENHLLSMNPGDLQYINEKGESQKIADPNRNARSESENNTITYKDVYGKGIDLKFTTTTTHVTKELIIESKENLPKPTITNPQLQLSVMITPPKNADLYITDPTNPLGGKVAWDTVCPEANCSTQIIANAEFRDKNPEKKDRNYDNTINDLDSILYSFIPAIARDSSKSPNTLSSTITGNENQQRLDFSISKVGENQMIAKVATPYSWLDSAQYPVSIDPTVSFSGDSTDGYLINSSTTYSTAQAGSGTFVTDTSASTSYIGQAAGAPGTTYYAYQSFFAFDTSSITANSVITDATFKLYGNFDFSDTDFTAYAAIYDWGTSITTADWQNTAGLQALSEVASFNTSGFSTSGYNSFTNVGSGLINGINKTGTTRLISWSDRLENSTTPTGSEFVWVNTQESANDPVLEVVYHKDPDQMQFYLQMEDADINTTYNSMTIGPPWDNSNKLVGTDTAVAFSTPPCENAANNGHTRIPVDTDGVATGEKCVATFFGPPVGKGMTVSTNNSNSIGINELDAVIADTDSDAAATASVRYYKFDGSSYTLFGTITSGALSTISSTLNLTGTPSSTVTFTPTDRIVVVVTTTITVADTSSGTDRIIFDFGKRSDPANIVVKHNVISTLNKPELSGPHDDDFNVVQAQQDCNAGLTYNTIWTCIEQTDDGNLRAGVSGGTGTTGWLTITDTENSTLNSIFSEAPTYMYQTVNTNTDGDGSVTTAMNFGTNEDIGTSPFFNGGLLLWTSDSDYIILQVHDNGTNKVVAINDDGTLSNSTTLSRYNLVYLRWTKRGSNYQASYSADGLTYTNIGASISHSTAFTRVGLTSQSAAIGEHNSAAFDWFDYTLGGDTQDAAMLGHWKLDEGAGTTANNSGTLKNTINGTLTNMASPATASSGWSNSGKIMRSLNFDNSDDSVSLGTNSIFEFGSDQSFSISAWVKPDTNDGFIFFYGDTDDQWYALQYNDSGLFSFDVDDDVTKSNATTAGSYAPGSWYHVAAVRDRPNDEIRIYVNGKLADTTPDDTGSINNSTQRTTYIGRKTATGAGGQFYDGLIDEVKLYNTPLSATEVAIDYNASKSLALGVLGTDASGNPSNAMDRSYCPPGDTTATCGPVAEWTFEEGSGTSVKDTSGNGFNGSAASATRFTAGKIGSGIGLTGQIQSYVDIPTSATLAPTSSLTVQFWYKSSNIAQHGGVILAKGGSYSFFSSNNDCRFGSALCFDVVIGGSEYKPSVSTSTLANNVWYHFVGTYDGTNVRLYVNGVLKDTVAATGSVGYSASHPLCIGDSSNFDCSNGAWVTGTMDQVRIYNYARSASQIAWDYNRGDPIAHWKFDECTGTTAYDSSGNQLNGTLTPGASGATLVGDCTTSATSMRYNGRLGKRNYGIDFDGTDDYVQVSDTSLLDITGSISLAAWVKTSDTNNGSIVGKWESTNRSFDLILVGNSLQMYVTGNGTSNRFRGKSNAGVNDNNWHHVVGVYDVTTQTMALYLDGKALVLDETSGSAFPTALFSGSADVRIGADQNTVNGVSYLDGLIDDVRIYNYPVTAQQVKTIMNEGAVRWGPATGTP